MGVITHVEPLLGAHLLHQQDFRYAQFLTHIRNCLSVHEILLQPNVPVVLKVIKPRHEQAKTYKITDLQTACKQLCQKMVNAGFGETPLPSSVAETLCRNYL